MRGRLRHRERKLLEQIPHGKFTAKDLTTDYPIGPALHYLRERGVIRLLRRDIWPNHHNHVWVRCDG